MDKNRLERLQRIEELKQQVQIKIRDKSLQNNEFLQDCLRKLTDSELIKEYEEIDKIIDLIHDNFSIKYHHIDGSYELTFEELGFIPNKKYYIVWDNAQLPIIKCLGTSILMCFDDVTALSFDTYIVAEDFSEIIHYDESEKIFKLAVEKADI